MDSVKGLLERYVELYNAGMELVKVRDGEIVVDNLYYDNPAVAAPLLPQAAPVAAW